MHNIEAKMKKVLYFDVETTGLLAGTNEITQLGYILDIDGDVAVERSLLMRPLRPDTVDPKALEVQHRTIEEVMGFPHPFTAYHQFLADLGSVIDKYDREDKAWPCAFNGTFDISFLSAWFESFDDKYLGSWINWKLLDPMQICRYLQYADKIQVENFKLGTIAAYYGIDTGIQHDALSDVRTLRAINNRIGEHIHSSAL